MESFGHALQFVCEGYIDNRLVVFLRETEEFDVVSEAFVEVVAVGDDTGRALFLLQF